MDFDLIFVVGIALIAFSIPLFASAYADRRRPKLAVMMLLIAGGGIAYAMQENPGAYSLGTIDDVVVNVLGRYLN